MILFFGVLKMSLFDKIIAKDNKIQRMRLSQVLCGVNVIRLTMSTIFLYMIPTAISKYVVDIMNLYVFGILAGLTGAFWGYIITRAENDRDDLMILQPWFSQQKYLSLMTALVRKTFIYIIVFFAEIFLISLLKLY